MIKCSVVSLLRTGLAVIALVLAGCLGYQIEANQQQLAQQQAQLDQLKQQIEALQTQRASYALATPPAGSCDDSVMREATRKGGERFASGDFPRALAYYEDAVAACPQNARAHLNVARTDEALGDRPEAIAQYKLVAAATGPDSDPAAIAQAHTALARLH